MEEIKAEELEISRALANEDILCHLFTYLSLDDIKNCRLTNNTWRNVGSSFLRQKTKVFVHFPPTTLGQKQAKEKVQQVVKYAKCYTGNEFSQRNSPFSTFEFTGRVPLPILNQFMKRGGPLVKDLDLTAEIVSDSCEKFLEMKKLVLHPELRSLTIFLDKQTPLFYNLSPNRYHWLRDLYLNNCKIYLFQNIGTLSLKKIYLGSKNEYFANGDVLEEFLVNSVFDLKNVGFLKLEGKPLVVDLGVDDIAAKEISREVALKDIKVINWGRCNWKVKALTLSGVPLLDKTPMQIEDLTVYKSTVNLALLENPNSMKVLSVLEDSVLLKTSFDLANLTTFDLEAKAACSVLPLFSKSRKLSQLSFHHYSHIDTMQMSCTFNTNNFPVVTKFSLSQVLFNDTHRLDELEINSCQILNNDLLYNQWKFDYEALAIDDNAVSFSSPIRYLYVLSSSHEYMNRIMVGPFGWIRWRVEI